MLSQDQLRQRAREENARCRTELEGLTPEQTRQLLLEKYTSPQAVGDAPAPAPEDYEDPAHYELENYPPPFSRYMAQRFPKRRY